MLKPKKNKNNFQFLALMKTIVWKRTPQLPTILKNQKVLGCEEFDVALGHQVGYSVRFEDITTEHTVLKFCTDEMLVVEATRNPLLETYGIIVLDEAHERTLNNYLLMAHLKVITG
ncbi:hypothetical protein niasHT_008670 [Heterodera trifolii]|uniref:RNA helicase n=1 Tax=Heterodera trifolii TaxID=157864 RepID=A0ABD2M6S7_9BILA